MLPAGLLLAAVCTLNFDAGARAFDPPAEVWGAYRVEAADLDGDGRLDLVVSDRPSYIRFGDGEVRLTNASRAIVADVNRDRLPDLVVTYGASSQDVGIMLNRGNGDFAPPQTIFNGGFGSLVVGDFTNDGAPDIIEIFGQLEPAFLLNDGQGAFSTHWGSAPALSTGNVSANEPLQGDFDGDGNLDLAVSGQQLKLFFGNGGGYFTEAQAINTAYEPLAAGDLDGDGKDELIVNGNGGLQIRRGSGAIEPLGPRQLQPLAAAIADFDRDGTPDVAVQMADDRIHLFFTGGRTSSFFIPTAAGVLTAADTDRDGADDLIVQSGVGIGILRNDGHGNFPGLPRVAAPAFTFQQTHAADVDGDGVEELLAITQNAELALIAGADMQILGKYHTFWWDARTGQLAAARSGGSAALHSDGIDLLRRDTGGTWQVQTSLEGITAWSLVLADFTGDGVNELLVSSRDETLKYALRIIDLSLGRTLLELPDSPYADAADINGDGRMDLVTTYPGTPSTLPHDYYPRPDGYIDVRLNTGNLNFLPPRRVLSGYSLLRPVVGDFDGDGADELAAPTNFAQLLLVSKGTVTTLLDKTSDAYGREMQISVGDLNDDGFDDLAAIAVYDNLHLFTGSENGLTHRGTFMPVADYPFPIIVRLSPGMPRAILMREELLNEPPRFAVLQPTCVPPRRRGVRH